MIPILSAKSLKNTCKETCIIQSFSVSMNKVFEIHRWRNSFFQFTILRFFLYKWNWDNDFIFHKTNFEKLKKLESIVNIFVFFVKISCQRKESPRLPFLRKIFHLHPYCQIRRTRCPLPPLVVFVVCFFKFRVSWFYYYYHFIIVINVTTIIASIIIIYHCYCYCLG